MDFIELDGVALRYELSGKGDRTLALVHEMGGSLESWDDIAPRFADSRRARPGRRRAWQHAGHRRSGMADRAAQCYGPYCQRDVG